MRELCDDGEFMKVHQGSEINDWPEVWLWNNLLLNYVQTHSVESK